MNIIQLRNLFIFIIGLSGILVFGFILKIENWTIMSLILFLGGCILIFVEDLRPKEEGK